MLFCLLVCLVVCLFVSLIFFFLVSFQLYCFWFRRRLLFEFVPQSQITFSLAVADCASGTNLHGLAGFIASPNFPNNYSQYSRCAWNITVPNGHIIELTFHYFQLEPGHYSPCYHYAPGARVTITNVATNNNDHPFMLCGQSVPPPVYSMGNSIQVIFTSLHNQYSGFNATYKAVEGTNDVNPINHASKHTLFLE